MKSDSIPSCFIDLTATDTSLDSFGIYATSFSNASTASRIYASPRSPPLSSDCVHFISTSAFMSAPFFSADEITARLIPSRITRLALSFVLIVCLIFATVPISLRLSVLGFSTE